MQSANRVQQQLGQTAVVTLSVLLSHLGFNLASSGAEAGSPVEPSHGFH